MIEFKMIPLFCMQQSPIKVYYAETEVGNYFADILVEIKAGKGEIMKEHEMQISNYLKAINYEVALLLHFGEKPTFKRVVFSNEYK